MEGGKEKEMGDEGEMNHSMEEWWRQEEQEVRSLGKEEMERMQEDERHAAH